MPVIGSLNGTNAETWLQFSHQMIEQTNEGAYVALQIQAGDGTASILRFKTVAMADSVDGMPRPL